MSRVRVYLAALVATTALAGPVVAADLPSSSRAWATPTRVASAWQGFYMGVHGGYSWSSYDATLTPGPSVFEIDGSSFSGGLFAGINLQLAPQFVAGVEGDFTLYNPSGAALIGGSYYRADSDFQGTIRARLGMTFDQYMLFVTGGFAFADIEFAGPQGSSSRTNIGWALGAGIEARLTDQIFARAEYIYTAFGEDDYALGPIQRISSDFDTHTMRVGLGIRF